MITKQALAALALISCMGAAQSAEEDPPTPEEIVVAALVDRLGGEDAAPKLQISRPQVSGDTYRFCAITDAFNAAGFLIGYTYWDMYVSMQTPDEVRIRDVTGLLSECYSAQFGPPGQ